MERLNSCVVKLWGLNAGLLEWNESQGFATFRYYKEFLDKGYKISPLKVPLEEKTFFFPELRINRNLDKEFSDTFYGLPGIFADSLPERYGNHLMKSFLERQKLDFEDLNPIERLCYVGKRGMGALEYEPAVDLISNKEEKVFVDELLETARNILSETENKEENAEEDKLLDQLIEIGTSAGGAKAKALIALKKKDDKITNIYSGQASPREDLSYWILKFSDTKNDEHHSDKYTGALEYAYYLMAKECGIVMMDSDVLKDSSGVAHFMTKRFDRVKGTKIHMATFCGIAHQDRNPPGQVGYEKLFSTMRELQLSFNEVQEVYRRMVFNVLSRNQDDHTKNHSFLMFPDGTWRLSPAYDLCFSYKKDHKFIGSQQMSVNGKRDDFTMSDLLECASHADITKAKAKKIIEQVQEGISKWNDCAKQAELPESNALAVQSCFRKI